MKPVLSVEHLGIILGACPVLQDISFTAGAGECIGIIGANGAGKSTLLRCLRGFLPEVSGHVHIFGRDVRKMPDKELAQQVAYMQQDVQLGFGFTGLEVVLAGRYPYLKWWQHERRQDVEIARRYMEFTGVADLADRPVQAVSGGQRQRILLAKVLAQETPLIFLDEPTASLDLVYQEEIFRYCQTMSEQGKTIVMIAHDIKQAAKFCSRLLLLAGGRLIADGRPEQVITEKNLKIAYGLQAAVYINQITGILDLHTYAAATATHTDCRVHVIGGGGAAATVLRLLYENGYSLTCGVLAEGDNDAQVAGAFHIDGVFTPAFSGIDQQAGAKNRLYIEKADIVLLTNICFGQLNLDNLLAAGLGRRIIILEDSPVTERDYTGGQAAGIYKKLTASPNALVMTTEALMQRIMNGNLQEI